jgi:hypothetical protein
MKHPETLHPRPARPTMLGASLAMLAPFDASPLLAAALARLVASNQTISLAGHEIHRSGDGAEIAISDESGRTHNRLQADPQVQPQAYAAAMEEVASRPADQKFWVVQSEENHWFWVRLRSALPSGGPYKKVAEAVSAGAYTLMGERGVDMTGLPPPVAELEVKSALVDELAEVFVRELRRAVPAEQVDEIARRNWVEAHRQGCHSYDFCDAGGLMAGAFREVLGIDPDARSSSQGRAWRMAWPVAQKMLLPAANTEGAEPRRRVVREGRGA